MQRYHEWQLESELEPVEFHARRAPALLRTAREALGNFIGADADDLVYVTNATLAVNIVARSLKLGPDDEVLGTDHEYGACDRIWRFLRTRGGAQYRQAHIPVPVTSHEEMLEQLFAQVRPATRVLFISHITAPTALTFPVAEACRRARALGLITVIDGAHVPGQIPLDLRAIDPDFYTGNLHKWLCAPKGAAFLYARRDMQSTLEPLIVSWGYEALAPSGSRYIDEHEYTGTRDLAAALTVPDAIAFRQGYAWDEVVARSHDIVRRARGPIADALDAMPIAPESGEWFTQMSAFLLPIHTDGARLQRRLFEEHLVEIPVFPWNGRQTLRISVQGYNDWDDVERLLAGIRAIGRTA